MCVIFREGTERYALALDGVDEVLDPKPISFVPQAPAPCLGVVVHQGLILPVFDVGVLLSEVEGEGSGAPEPVGTGALTRLIVLSYADFRLALQVDRVERIAPLTGAPQPVEAGSRGTAERYLDAVFVEPDGVVTRVNTSALVEGIDRLFER
ncbi:MAG: chemotaxis protein CheW [Bdellovibrionota bacterium]